MDPKLQELAQLTLDHHVYGVTSRRRMVPGGTSSLWLKTFLVYDRRMTNVESTDYIALDWISKVSGAN